LEEEVVTRTVTLIHSDLVKDVFVCKEMYEYLILLLLPIFICYLDLDVISFYLLAAD
jgi:hypothetical protein